MASWLGEMPTTSVLRLDLAVETLDRIRRVQLGAVLLQEGGVAGEHVGFGIIHDGSEHSEH